MRLKSRRATEWKDPETSGFARAGSPSVRAGGALQATCGRQTRPSPFEGLPLETPRLCRGIVSTERPMAGSAADFGPVGAALEGRITGDHEGAPGNGRQRPFPLPCPRDPEG